MNMTGNTILITGAGSGIGLALAREFARMDNQVIVAARSPDKLKAAEQRGLAAIPADVSDAASIRALATRVMQEFPKTNVVIHNAAISKREDLVQGGDSRLQEETVATNLLGPMRLTNALMPHLLQQRSAAILIVSSGLAFVPSAFVPTYSATKAALHSYAQSLRFQLRDTPISVIEIPPPYVQTELGGRFQATDPNAMPLRDFIAEVLQILKSDPHVEEVLVKRVLPHRYAAEHGRENYDAFFEKYHSRVM
jgi:uncharacterized oxidoreductase